MNSGRFDDRRPRAGSPYTHRAGYFLHPQPITPAPTRAGSLQHDRCPAGSRRRPRALACVSRCVAENEILRLQLAAANARLCGSLGVAAPFERLQKTSRSTSMIFSKATPLTPAASSACLTRSWTKTNPVSSGLTRSEPSQAVGSSRNPMRR